MFIFSHGKRKEFLSSSVVPFPVPRHRPLLRLVAGLPLSAGGIFPSGYTIRPSLSKGKCREGLTFPGKWEKMRRDHFTMGGMPRAAADRDPAFPGNDRGGDQRPSRLPLRRGAALHPRRARPDRRGALPLDGPGALRPGPDRAQRRLGQRQRPGRRRRGRGLRRSLCLRPGGAPPCECHRQRGEHGAAPERRTPSLPLRERLLRPRPAAAAAAGPLRP